MGTPLPRVYLTVAWGKKMPAMMFASCHCQPYVVFPGHPTSVLSIPVVSQMRCLTAGCVVCPCGNTGRRGVWFVHVGTLGHEVCCLSMWERWDTSCCTWLCVTCLVPSLAGTSGMGGCKSLCPRWRPDALPPCASSSPEGIWDDSSSPQKLFLTPNLCRDSWSVGILLVMLAASAGCSSGPFLGTAYPQVSFLPIWDGWIDGRHGQDRTCQCPEKRRRWKKWPVG